LVGLLVAGIAGHAEETDQEHLERIQEKDDVDRAVDKALAWLVQKQDVTHGYFQGGCRNTYTALACMALMATGHFEGRSEYGEHLRRGVLYLAKEGKAQNGYFGRDGGRMYGHGICTLTLCEAYGMMRRPEDNQAIRETLDLALGVILKAQATANNQHKGGWRYEPTSQDADLSVTAWQILALRAAQNCKLHVPEEAIEQAVAYVRRVYQPGQGFSYQGGGASPAMRCAGAVCMKVLGADEDEEDRTRIETSAKILETVNMAGGSHYYYQTYYFATAANMMGDEYRNTLLPKLEKALLNLQDASGEFRKHSGHDGGVYSTAFATICLAVRYQFLPIYQE
jgi:hypothetical protein